MPENEVINEKANRLELVRKRLDINKSELARRVESPQSHISKLLRGEVPMGDLLSDKISRRLHINPVWWETGEGDMFLGDTGSYSELAPESAAAYEAVSKSDGRLLKQGSGRKAQLYLAQLPDKEAESYIPYYDVEITAGKIELYFDDVDELPEGYVYAPQYRGCIACNVKGDSMYDRIYPGSRLYVYHLANRKYIDFGQIYLVVLDGHRLLKYIHPHPTDETKIRLSSYNTHYQPWDVDKADILNLFIVKGYENQSAM